MVLRCWRSNGGGNPGIWVQGSLAWGGHVSVKKYQAKKSRDRLGFYE